MTPITISYRIKLSEKMTEVFDFTLDGESGDLISETPANPPPWTALDYRQCSHCPLSKSEHPHCPIALQLYHIIERFHNTSSIDQVELEVITEERRISQALPLQRAIGSMLGLVSPTCGCPKMAYMKPMARFHLPLASEEETLFRVAGMYLLAQYVLGKNGLDNTSADFSGLKAIYEDLHILNKALATRLRGATESDSSKNAIALLDMYSNLVPLMIDDQLPELKNLFSAYSRRGNRPVAPTDNNEPVVPVDSTKQPIVESVPDVVVPVTAPELTLEPIVEVIVTASEPVPVVTAIAEHEPAVVIAPELTLEPIVVAASEPAPVVPLPVKPVREKTADELALEALMQEVPADELAELLGLQQEVVVKKEVLEKNVQEKPRGRAVFDVPTEPLPEPKKVEAEPAPVQERPKGRAVFKLADD